MIATTEPLDTSTVLLFILSFYRSLIHQGDERASFRKAKTTILSGDKIRLYDREAAV